MSSADKALPSTIAPVPAPWELQAESWWFIHSLVGGGTQDVAPGNLAPLEEISRAEATKENFKGGLGTAMLVRYSDSPAGPYDELLFSPGKFKSGVHPPALRLTRCYVSTLASVANGRRNWNVPKHLARFEFIPSPSNPKATEVRIYAPLNESTVSNPSDDPIAFAERPFFAALLTPSSLPAMPYNVKYSPFDLVLVQPPLEESPTASLDGLVSASTWKSILPGFKGSIKLVSYKPLLDADEEQDSKSPEGKISTKPKPKRYGNGVNFPDFKPYSMGVYWPNATITFGNPRVF